MNNIVQNSEFKEILFFKIKSVKNLLGANKEKGAIKMPMGEFRTKVSNIMVTNYNTEHFLQIKKAVIVNTGDCKKSINFVSAMFSPKNLFVSSGT